MSEAMTTRECNILLVSDDAGLRATARHELETVDERRHVSSVSSLAAARRILEDAAPDVILLADSLSSPEKSESKEFSERLDMTVSSLASYAPVVVIGDAEHQTELSGLVAAGAADYVVRTGECLNVALGLVERRLQRIRNRSMQASAMAALSEQPQPDLLLQIGREDFGEILRHELNNPLTGILGNAELLLAEIRRKGDGRMPSGAQQRLETIASLAVRLRESVRRLSQDWEARHAPASETASSDEADRERPRALGQS
ncbi:MAG TPA: histidine kinase dimerization/phospho-acceptor domain-containing protein [Candidatus Acidoferrum sp.]|nr:histidine kinase dimerization/phospho-acceptor domain-containing protein [Candidatus Acidoferrum sp.]